MCQPLPMDNERTCINLSKFLNFSVPHFPHRKNGVVDSISIIAYIIDLKQLIPKKAQNVARDIVNVQDG